MPDERYPPAARFHHGRDFSRCFDRGQKAAGRSCVVLLRPRGRGPGSEAPCARLGAMVPVKMSKLSVRRHQVKRWARELFRLRLKERLAGWDIMLLLRADPADHATFDAEVLSLVDRALAAKPEGRRKGPRR